MRASTRISIRWPPAAATEPTDTLVLSLGGYYVDLRVRKSDGQIDWLLTGERIVVSESPLRVKFTHDIDSHHTTGEPSAEPDVGDFKTLPNGDDFETGEMANPDNGGRVMPYEENWRQLDWRRGVSSGSMNWVLESVDEKTTHGKTVFLKLGCHFLGAHETNEDGRPVYHALRQEFDADQHVWKTLYDIGKEGHGSQLHRYSGEAQEEAQWKVGQVAMFGGAQYKVKVILKTPSE